VIPILQVDAFTERPFGGNPAAVVLDAHGLSDRQMQAIAAENNLAETAFVIERNGYFDVRWMTPTVEVDLCGHATLASAHVIFHHLGRTGDRVRFQSRSGELTVARVEDRLVLDFPSQPPSSCELPEKLVQGLRAQPRSVWKGPDYLAVFDREQDIKALAPDFDMLAQLDARGTIVTALGDDCDFVSRFFAPQSGIAEDPVTGSTHCVLIPYWSKRLGKKALHARQLSKRGGDLFCEDRGERVGIGGNAVTYVEGKLHTS
jgi:PhzF family phenazine biosynthesis protein